MVFIGLVGFRWAIGVVGVHGVDYTRVYTYDEEGRLVRIERDEVVGGVRLAYEAQYNGDGFRVWDREWVWEPPNPPLEQEYRYVCGVGCGRLPLRVYRQENGWWISYEWYVRLLRAVWYSGYESESVYAWLNMDYPLLSGHLLVGELVAAPWMVELMYDRFGVYVGERFHPQKVKRWAKYFREHADMPPTDPMNCCLLKCMEAAGAGTGAAGESVECLLKGYGGVWRGL